MQDERFAIGDHWLTQRPGSGTWYATWYETETRQTRRRSLGTEDFRQAQLKLAEYVTKYAEIRHAKVDEITLAKVLVRYWHQHACNLPSKDTARFALSLWTEFWGDTTIAGLTVPRQKKFIEWLKARG